MNRRFRLLLLAIILALGLTPASASENPPNTPRQMAEGFNRAYTNANFVEAIRWGLKIEESQPGQARHQYNLACVYALAGNEQTAIAWLHRSVENGFRRVTTIENDSDLKILREHPQWAEILAAVRTNAQSYRQAVRQAFSREPPEIVLPPDHDPEFAAPLIVAMHGYGGRPGGYPALWRPAAGKIGAILATPRGLQPRGEGFFWGDLEEADTVIQLTIEYVKQSHLIDDSRIILTGFSQGGFMAMAVGARHPDVFAGIIPMAGGYNPAIDTPDPAPPGAPRFFFMVGGQDNARTQCSDAAEAFEAAGYAVKLRIYPGVGHSFALWTNRELGKALKFVLEN